MPIHDWTRVGPWVFGSFRLCWIAKLMRALNIDLLSGDIYSLITLIEEPKRQYRDSNLTIYHASDHRIIAKIEIASQQRPKPDRESILKQQDIPFILVDLHPQGVRNPDRSDSDSRNEMSVVSHSPKPIYRTLIESVTVGDKLPAMPLLIESVGYINIPLEETYLAAFESTPQLYRKLLE